MANQGRKEFVNILKLTTMKQITENEYSALVKKISDTLMEAEEMGMGEWGECNDEAERIVNEWMEEYGIAFPEEV